MNTTQAYVDVVQSALDSKQINVNANYDGQMIALRERALSECSLFAFRRTPERAEEYLFDNLPLLLAHGRIETRRENAQDWIDELRKLIRISVGGVITIDGETANWLFPGGVA